MNTVPEIIERLGGNAEVSRKLSKALERQINPSTVSEMKRRKSIPLEYWGGFMAISNGKVSMRRLYRAHVGASQ